MGWLSPPPLVSVLLFFKIFIDGPSICFSHASRRLAWARSHGGRSAKASKASHVKGKEECTSSVETSLGLLFANIASPQASFKAKPESEQGVVTVTGKGVGRDGDHPLMPLTPSPYHSWLRLRNHAISCFNIPYNYPLCTEHSGQAKH